MNFSLRYKIYFVILVILATSVPSAWATTTSVAIVPFQINAEKDYTFLQQGIVEMLTSRLSSNRITVTDAQTTASTVAGIRGMTGDSLALMAAAKLKADFVIHGSLTVLGESVSIDAKMLNVTGTQPPLHFFKQTPSMNEVIPQINQLATEINTKVFLKQTPTVAAVPTPAPVPQSATPTSDIHAHPEKLLQSGNISGGNTDNTSNANPLNPAFLAEQGTNVSKANFWKSRNYGHLMNGLAVGDVNNDGLVESVVVTPKKVLIYQASQNRMRQIAAIDSPKFTLNIGVDVGDINQNGTPEIFITALSNQRNSMASYVIEFDGAAFKTIVSKTRWYFRIIDNTNTGPLLLGQKQLSGAHPHSAPIMEMGWQGGEYTSTGQLLPGNKANLLGVALGGLANDGGDNQVVALNPSDNLIISERNGKRVWTSGELYGGTPLYFTLPLDDPGGSNRSVFFPIRVRALDLDGDGKLEVITPQNSDSSGRKLAEHRFFKKSKLVALTWDGLGLTPSWQTRSLSGRIQDIVVADFDNDGKMEILAAMVTQDPSAIRKAKSALIAFEIKTP